MTLISNEMSDNEEEQGPKSTFSTYMAEGDQLFLKGEYTKATESYSTALTLQPDDKNCLVARSKCYVKMGDSENALQDAEASLNVEKNFFKGLYQKAEALYIMGEFESALIFYHRGHKLRSELQEFRLGIQKAQEAINNSVGSPSSVKLKNEGDLTFLQKAAEALPKNLVHPKKKEPRHQGHSTPRTEKTVKQLLGELYTDKEYLEKLLKDEDLVKAKTRSGEQLQDVILSSISYLDTRTDFWHQQKPIYARQRDQRLLRQQWNCTHNQSPSDPTHYILKNLEEIDAELHTGNTEKYMRKAQEVLKIVQGYSEEALPDKNEVLENLYSCIGNALMDLEDMDKALENHLKALELVQQGKSMESKSRVLDNISRVYTCTGKFQQAIEALEERVPLVQKEEEKACLFHEIGCWYLKLKCHTEARVYGTRSLNVADNISNMKWQLNASVLVAQAEMKLGNYKTSLLHFERALDRAKLLQDHAAKDAIQKALRKTMQQMVK